MNFDDIIKQKQENTSGAVKDPLLSEQGYATGYDAVTGLSGLGGDADAREGTLGDISNFGEGRVFLGGDLEKARAANQTTAQKFGNAALKVIPGIAMGIAETAGYMLDAENYAAFFTGANNNYDNWFSKYMRDAREGLDEYAPVYQREAGKAWDPGDAGWWANSAGGLVESLAEFWLLGAATGGVGSYMGLAAKGARGAALARKANMLKKMGTLSPDKLLKAQARVAKMDAQLNMWNQVGQAASAFDTGVGLSAMNAVGTYESMLKMANESINPKTGEKYSEDDAKMIAEEAAATTFNTSLLFNSAMNFTSMSPFFRGKTIPPRAKMKVKPRETTDDFLERLRSIRNNPETLKQGNSLMDRWYVEGAMEMGQEAIEEYGEGIASQLGENVGKEKITGQSQKLDLMNEDLFASVVLGAIGGGLGFGAKKFFDRNNDAKIQENFTADLDYRINQLETFKANQTKLAEARKTGDEKAAQEAESALFTGQLFDSIVNDTVDVFVAQMEDIAKMGVEEAKAMGFNVDESVLDTDANGKVKSNDYRSRAEQAIELVKQGKSIAQAIQQDDTLPPGIKPIVMRKQLEAAFNEQIIQGIENDLNILNTSFQAPAGGPTESSSPYFANLQAQLDSVNSLLKRYQSKATVEGGTAGTKKGSPKVDKRYIESLEQTQARLQSELDQHIEAQKTMGVEYDGNQVKLQPDYLHRTQLYRELESRKALAKIAREDLSKFLDPEFQQQQLAYYENIEKRPTRKGKITQKVKDLLGSFYALGEGGSPEAKKAVIDELKTLMESGEIEALDIDPEHDTASEVIEEALAMFNTPEDLKAYFNEDQLGTYDPEADERVDDGTVTFFENVVDSNGDPVMEEAPVRGEKEGDRFTEKQPKRNVKHQQSLADIFAQLKGAAKGASELTSLENKLDTVEGMLVQAPFQNLIDALQATFDEQKRITIERHKGEVKLKLDEQREAVTAEALVLASNLFKDLELDMNKRIKENDIKTIGQELGALRARLIEEYGYFGLEAFNLLVDMVEGQIPNIDTRYEDMSIQDIFDSYPTRNEDNAVEVRWGDKLGFVTFNVKKNAFVFIPRDKVFQSEELINNSSATELKKQGILILKDSLVKKAIKSVDVGVVMQEAYPVDIVMGSDPNNPTKTIITVGDYKFVFPKHNPMEGLVIEGDYIKSIKLVDAAGNKYTISDPQMVEDLADVFMLYAMAFEQFAEENKTVGVTNSIGNVVTYSVEFFDAANPEKSIIKTANGKEIPGLQDKLETKYGERTLKGKVIDELTARFAEVMQPILTGRKQQLDNEINQQQASQSNQVEGTEDANQEGQSESDGALNEKIRQLEQSERSESDRKLLQEKIREYSGRYENKIRSLIEAENFDALRKEKEKFENIARYAGETIEVQAQRASAEQALKLINGALKAQVAGETAESRGDAVVNNTKKVDAKTSITGDAGSTSNEEVAANLYANEEDFGVELTTGPPVINDDLELDITGLTLIPTAELANASTGTMAMVEDGNYQILATKEGANWKVVAVVNTADKTGAVLLKGTSEAAFVNKAGETKKIKIEVLQKQLAKALAEPIVVAYEVTRDQAGDIYKAVKKAASPSQTVEARKATVKKDISEKNLSSIQLFTPPGIINHEVVEKNGKKINRPAVTLDAAGNPEIAIGDFEFITQEGLDMLHDPTVTSKTHTVRFKVFPNGNSWWNKNKDKYAGKEAQAFPIYVELVNRVTGEATIVNLLASTDSKSEGHAQRKAIYDALMRGEEVTAEIKEEGGRSKLFNTFKDGSNGVRNVNVLNVFDAEGNPVMFPVFHAMNGLTNTWHRSGDTFSKDDQKDKIVLLTTTGVGAEKSVRPDGSKIELSLSQNLGNLTPEELSWLKKELDQEKYRNMSSFAEGQILTPMVGPDGKIRLVPLSTANLTENILEDFFFTPLGKLDANAVSAQQFEEFTADLSAVLNTKQKPTQGTNENFFELDQFTDGSGTVVVRFYHPTLKQIVAVNLTNYTGKLAGSGLIEVFSNQGMSGKVKGFTQSLSHKDGNSKFKSEKQVEITVQDLMDALAAKKLNVDRGKLNSKGAYELYNPTTGQVQAFDSYNAFLIGMPGQDNAPNMLINKDTKAGSHTSPLGHNMMNNNGTVFANAGISMNKITAEVEKKVVQRPKRVEQKTPIKTEKAAAPTNDNALFTKIFKGGSVPVTSARVMGYLWGSWVNSGATDPKQSDVNVIVTDGKSITVTDENIAITTTGKDGVAKENVLKSIKELAELLGRTLTINGKPVELTAAKPVQTKPLELSDFSQEIQDTVAEIKSNSEFVKLSDDGSVYEDLRTGAKYKRVSSVVSPEGITNPNETVKSALAIGTKVDTVVRDFFDDNLKSPSEYGITDDSEVFNNFIEKLTEIKAAMTARGEIVLANDITLYDAVQGIAGTVDLLTVDKDGNFRIYDMKTMKGNQLVKSYDGESAPKYDSTKFGKSNRQKHQEQLSLYHMMLYNTHGIDAVQLGIMPIEVEYKGGDTKTTKLEIQKGIPHKILERVESYFKNDYSDYQEGDGEDKTINYKLEDNSPKADDGVVSKATGALGSLKKKLGDKTIGPVDLVNVTAAEHTAWVDTGKVSKEVIEKIANKQKNNVRLSPEELAILGDKAKEINERLVELKAQEKKAEPKEVIVPESELEAKLKAQFGSGKKTETKEEVRIQEFSPHFSKYTSPTLDIKITAVQHGSAPLDLIMGNVRKGTDYYEVSVDNKTDENKMSVDALIERNRKLSKTFKTKEEALIYAESLINSLSSKSSNPFGKVSGGKENNNNLFRKAPKVDKDARMDINKAAAWLNKRGISFDQQKQVLHHAEMVQGGHVHGYFTKGLVYLSSSGEVGTEFHEAFHAVFSIWTTDAQRAGILAEARQKYRKPSAEELASLSKMYPDLTAEQVTDLYYEEVMAEKFREYVITKQKPRTIGEQLWKWIKDLFNYMKTYASNKRTIDQMFSNIESGFINKRFTRKVPADLTMFSIKQGYNAKNVEHIVSAINTKFVIKYDQLKNAGAKIPSASQVFREIREDFLLSAVERLVPASSDTSTEYKMFEGLAKQAGVSVDRAKLELGRLLMDFNEALKNEEADLGEVFDNAPISEGMKDMAAKLFTTGDLLLPNINWLETTFSVKLDEAQTTEFKEAKAFLDINTTWNSVTKDDNGLLLPEQGWQDLAITQLKDFGITIKGSVLADTLSYEQDKIYSKDSIEESRMDTLSGKVKNLLSRVPKADGSRVLGIVPYIPFSEVASKMQMLFAESGSIRSLSTMMQRLQNKSVEDVAYKALYDKLLELVSSNNMEDNILVADFYKSFALAYRNFNVLIEKISYDKGEQNVSIKNLDSNSQRVAKKLLTDWAMNSRRPGAIFTVSDLGEVVVNKTMQKNLDKAIAVMETVINSTTKVTDKHISALAYAYEAIGVHITKDEIKTGLEKGLRVGNNTLTGASLYRHLTTDTTNAIKGSGRGFKQLATRLKNANDSDIYAHEVDFFKKTAAFAAVFSDVTNLSFMDAKGKTIFPVNMHTTLTRQLDAMVHFGSGENPAGDAWVDAFMEDPLYNVNGMYMSPLLRLVMNNKGTGAIENLISYTTLDAYKRQNETVSSNDSASLTEVQEFLYRLNAFSNNSDKNSMYIVVPTLADRGNSMMVKMPRIAASSNKKLMNEAWGLKVNSYQEMFRAALVQDIKSMQKAHSEIGDKIKNNDPTDLIMFYHYNIGKDGKMVPGNYLQFSQLGMLNGTAVGKAIIKNFGTTSDDQFIKSLRESTSLVAQALQAVETYIDNQKDALLETLENLNIHRVTESKGGKKSATNPLDIKLWGNDLEAFARDFVIANIIGQNEIRKFTAGDVLMAKNYENYSKRMGGIMTPGYEGVVAGEEIVEGVTMEYGDMPEYTMAISKDIFSNDESYEFMQSLLEVEGVDKAKLKKRIEATYGKNKSNKTDAMGYVTLDKYRSKVMGQGMWSNVHEEAYNNYKEGKEFAIYDADGNITIRPLLQPLKTYHDGLYSHNGKKVRVLVKHATFPLLREFTKNSPKFNELRERMEGVGKYANLEPIHETNHVSGVKIGAINVNDVVSMTNEAGELDLTNMQTMPFKLDSRNQRIPQVIPSRVKASKVGSQLMKLAPASLSMFGDSKYQVGNASITGKEVFDKYQNVLTEMQNRELNKLYKRMGYSKSGLNSMSGEEQIKFLKKLRRLLKNTVEERGLSDNYLKALDIIPDKKGGYKYALPLSHPAFSHKFEQMMVSLFKNGPLNLTTNGKAFVQLAEFGTHATDGSLKFLGKDDNGQVKGVEIAIPYAMAEKLGLSKNENGDYDLSGVDERLLTLVGYRIPTQGKSAMLPMIIKRVLPESMGKVILVPGEITAQMGSDFDVDKLYTMMPNYKISYKTKTGKDYDLYKAFNDKLTKEFGETLNINAATLKELYDDNRVIEEIFQDGDIDSELSVPQLYEKIALVKLAMEAEIKKLGVDTTKGTAVYQQYNLEKPGASSDAGLENMFLELTRSILTNPNHLLDVLSPVDSLTAPSLKELMVKLLPNDRSLIEKLDPNDVHTEVILAMRNKVGGAGIGIYATQMTGTAVAEFTDTEVKPKYAIRVKKGNTTETYSKINRVVDDNGVSLIYSFSKHLTMAVDNANDPLMSFLNDNPFTSPVTSYIIRAGVTDAKLGETLAKKLGGTPEEFDFDGGPVEVATVIRMQPIVRELTKHFSNNEYHPGLIIQAMEEVLEKIGVKPVEIAKFTKKISQEGTTTLDLSKLVDNIGKDDYKDTKFLAGQLEVLGNFYHYYTTGREMSDINKAVFNTDVIRNKISSVADYAEVADVRKNLVKKLRTGKARIEGYSELLEDSVENSPYAMATSFNNMYKEMNKFLSPFLFYASSSFETTSEQIVSMLDKDKMTAVQYDAAHKFTMVYLLSNRRSPVAHMFNPEFYKPLLMKPSVKEKEAGTTNTIIDKLNVVKNLILAGKLPEMADNKFLASVDEHPDNFLPKTKVLALKFNNGGKLSKFEQNSLIDDFEAMFESDNKHVKELADALFAYNVVAKGLKSGVDSFADLIPISVYSEVTEYLNNQLDSELADKLHSMSEPFIENNSHVKGLVARMPEDVLQVMNDGTIELDAPAEGTRWADYYLMKDGQTRELVLYKKLPNTDVLFSRFENGTNVLVQKGVPYKLYEFGVTEIISQMAAVKEETDERSDCGAWDGTVPF